MKNKTCRCNKLLITAETFYTVQSCAVPQQCLGAEMSDTLFLAKQSIIWTHLLSKAKQIFVTVEQNFDKTLSK